MGPTISKYRENANFELKIEIHCWSCSKRLEARHLCKFSCLFLYANLKMFNYQEERNICKYKKSQTLFF